MVVFSIQYNQLSKKKDMRQQWKLSATGMNDNDRYIKDTEEDIEIVEEDSSIDNADKSTNQTTNVASDRNVHSENVTKPVKRKKLIQKMVE